MERGGMIVLMIGCLQGRNMGTQRNVGHGLGHKA